MDNPMTPRLVELVTRAQAIAKALNYIAGLARQMEVRQGCHKAMLESDFIASALSRLMAEGGLSKEPLGPLGPEELTKALENIAGDLVARGPGGFEDYSSAYARLKHIARSALQATNGSGSND